MQDKKSKVLVFDDPITSLDAPNLKILAELIHDQISAFDQIIVFTHHPLFHKYLTKPDINDKTKFGVLKNSDLFGGSFVFSDPGYDMTEEVRLCNQEIASKATAGSLKMEEISLKYGQLLRLAIEKFIKYELLMWNREGDFGSQIVGNLRNSKSKISKLDEDDLDVLTNIYNYCNQSNLLHVDKENPSALSELISNIDRFEKIMDKANLSS
jgi:wobble nucleotide-excising tRNase